VTLHADDRVLFLDIPSHEELAAIARILMHGVVVALGSREAVDRTRAAFAEFDNVMLIEADPQQIPWREDYFTKVVVPPHMESLLRSAAGEIRRVMTGNGELVSATRNG
jgi:hypothetical protein